MTAHVEARLAALQQEHQQTQQALAALEQERQGLLQALIGQQYALGVLQELLEAEQPHATAPVDGTAAYMPVAP